MTLKDVKKNYPKEADFIKHLELVLWNGTPVCPYCGASYFSPIDGWRYHCNSCNLSFSVTTRTMFHKTRVDLRKWAVVIFTVLNYEKFSLRELGSEIGVTKDTVALMRKRID